MVKLNTAVVERLFRYYQLLLFQKKIIEDDKNVAVSSGYIAEVFQIDPTQVRKDLAAVGIKGRQRVGYKVQVIIKKVSAVIGLTTERKAVIVGAGRLGGAIIEDKDFPRYGINFVAMFDSDSKKTGSRIGGKPVYSMKSLKKIIKKHDVKMGLITVPAEAAQQIAIDLVDAGVLALWNFTHVNIFVPPGVYIRNESISTGFAGLSYHLKRFNK